MKLVRGDELLEININGFEELLSSYTALWLDIGTGDGRFVYDQARANPHILCTGLDPAWKNMSRISGRAQRKKTVAPNALFLQGTVEDPPLELHGKASAISINYPWSGLLRALVLPEPAVLRKIRILARSAAVISVYLNMHVFEDEGVKQSLALPALNTEYVTKVLAPEYRVAGITIEDFSTCNTPTLRTTWGNRLTLNSGRPSCLLTLKAL